MKDDTSVPQPQPAAYDPEGRPLYYRPEQSLPSNPQKRSLVSVRPDGYEGHNFDPKIRAQYANEPDYTHATREFEPNVPKVSEALKRKHDASLREYPFLNLSEAEFVMLNIRRHPIGLLIPIFATAFVLIILVTLLMLVPDFYRTINTNDALVNLPGADMTVGILMILIVLAGLVGSAAVWIYLKNQFFLTNESVVQYVQYGLFSHREQTVSLGSIEDASFRRQGILQHILNYGTMRLSTEGEETTYRFAFVEDPKKQIATVNNAVEAFKNGRPVGTEFLD